MNARRAFLACIAVLAVPVSLFAQAEDIQAPEVQSYSLTSTTFDVRAIAASSAATLTATDDVSGVDSGSVCYLSPSHKTSQCATFSTLASGTRTNGVLSGSIAFQTPAEGGTWTVYYVQVRDVVGNLRTYYPTDANFPAGPRQLEVLSSAADLTPPTLASFSFSPSVDVSNANGSVPFQLEIPDSDFSYAYIYFQSPARDVFVSGFVPAGARISTNPNIYAGTVSMPRYSQPGAWRVIYIYVIDNKNNYTYYYNPEYCACQPLLPAGATQLNVASNPFDVGPPSLIGFDFMPKAIDVSTSSATVNLTAHITDDLAGITTVLVQFFSTRSSQSRTVGMFRSGGSALDGTFSGSAVFPQFSAAGVWRVNYVFVQDATGHYRYYFTNDLLNLGYPTFLQVSSGLLVYDAIGYWNQTVTLSARLTSALVGLPGKSIKFKLSGVEKGSAITDSDGIATLANVSVAGVGSGVHENAIEASFAGDSSLAAISSTGNLTVIGHPQTITFDAIGPRQVGDTFTLHATATSGLPVAFTLVSGPASLTGATAHLNAAGTVKIRASQSGGGEWAAADPVDQTFEASAFVDTTKPVVTAPADAAYQCASEVPAASPSQATATDNVGVTSLTVSETNNGGAGSTASPLVITRTWTARDAAGNIGIASQSITVADTTAPVITRVGGDVTLECHTGYVDAGATAQDNCGGNLTTSIVASGFVDVNTPNTYTITYNVTDAAGNIATSVTRTVVVRDTQPPSVVAPPAQSVTSTSCTVAVPDFGRPQSSDNCSLAGALSVSQVPAPGTTVGIGTTPVKITVTDPSGNSTSVWTAFTLTNDPPVANAGGPYEVNEGGSVDLMASGSDAGGAVTMAWDLDGDGVYETPAGNGVATRFSAAGLDGPSTRNIGLLVSDVCGQTTRATTSVHVSNVAPIVAITQPFSGAVFAVGSRVDLAASFTDAGTPDTHTCAVNWDNSSADATGAVAESSGSGTCTASNTFTSAGVHSITVTVRDDDGASGTAGVMIVVYDASGGFVTGGGFIASPAGALVDQPGASGKANFGFNAKYQKKATTPTGETTFHLNAANFKFDSASLEWLVVAGSKAQFRGTGSVNGRTGYGFLATMIDGDRDAARIKIWDRASGRVVYDNQAGAPDDLDAANPPPIDSGSIVVHK